MSDDLVEWLRAQLLIDEEKASRAGAFHPVWTYDREAMVVSSDGWQIAARSDPGGRSPLCDVDGEHIANWDPSRVLREVAVKRRMINLGVALTETEGSDPASNLLMKQAGEDILGRLAMLYTDLGRPGYQESWRPT